MTQRLYYGDSYLVNFDSIVEETAANGRRLYLQQSAFYPTSGGQPHDLGTINGIPVTDVVDEQDRVAHILAAPLLESKVTGVVNWVSRFDNMQQHTGQHLLSAVFEQVLGASTVSVHLGEAISTIDLGIAALSLEQIIEVEQQANRAVASNLAVSVAYEDAATVTGLRKPSERPGMLRIVTIEGLDKSACGGTHVGRSGEIGPILIRKLDKLRGNVRVEFLCGQRAVAQARRDFDTLGTAARHFSCPLEEVANGVEQLAARAKEQDKAIRMLKSELAAFEGKQLYESTAPAGGGLRHHAVHLTGAIGEEHRLLAQHFIAGPLAALLVTSSNPPSLLLACSADSGLHAGNLVKTAIAASGGKGGGSGTMAQASLPSIEALEQIRADLSQLGAKSDSVSEA